MQSVVLHPALFLAQTDMQGLTHQVNIMTSIQNMNANDKITQQQAVSANAGAAVQRHLKTSLLFLLATGAGLAVASLYYSQPMLGV